MGDPGTMAVKAGMMALSVGLNMLNKIEGPRLDDLDVTTADYGTPLIRFWGKRRLDGVPIMWAERLREKKTTSKTKGGKYSEYKYFGTFAVVVADHEIEAVTRIWLDKHLVYDVTGAGPISPFIGLFQGLSGSPVKITLGRNMRIYLGTETQEADPRMESWCEDRYGPDSCPAYRGVSYIVFEELPLEKFGNRIPQVTVEAVNVKAGSYPTSTVSSSIVDLRSFHFSYDFSRFYHYDHVWDTATRTLLNTNGPATDPSIGVMSDGTIYSTSGPGIAIHNKDGIKYSDVVPTLPVDPLDGTREAAGLVCFYRFPYGTGTGMYYLAGQEVIEVATDVPITHYFTDSAVEAKALGGGTGFFRIYDVATGNYDEIASLEISQNVYGFDNGEGQYVIVQGDILHLVDKATFAVLEQVPGVTGSSARWAFNSIRIGAPTFWLGTTEYSSTTLEVIRTINPANWGVGSGSYIYDPINHALINFNTGTLKWLYLDRATNETVTLGDVCEDVAGWCDVAVDADALTQEIPGYSVTQGAGKDMIGPLLDIHDATVRPHDFTVQFINRGGAVQGTILTENFVREGDEPRYTVTVKQDTDLPRKISLTFADNDKDQQVNTVISQRPLDAADTVREQQIDLGTYADTPSGAQQKLDRYFRRRWNERETTNNSLTYQYAGAEPGDSYTLDLDGVTRFATIKKMTFSQGRINTEWCRDALSFATLGTGTGAEMDGRDDEEIFVPGPAKGFVLDIPLPADSASNANPLLHYGMGGYGSFSGGTIYEADADGDELLVWNSVESSDGLTWGYCSDALGDANPNLWDRGNTIEVSFYGTLTSCTEADIEADPTLNMAVIRDEIVNFTTATLTGTNGAANLYDVSGFKRGRRGTEWATGDHAAGDAFILLSGLEAEGMGLSDVGVDLEFRAETLGRDPSLAEAIPVDFAGTTLKPYAPARVKFTTDGTDLTGEIIRRTRVGGSWLDSGVVSLSENSEEYEVDVYVGSTFKRTITVTGTDTFTYTAAMMSADGTTLSSLPTFNVYQMSDAVGRGFALAA